MAGTRVVQDRELKSGADACCRVLRGTDLVLAGDLVLPELIGKAVVRDVPAAQIDALAVAA